MPLFVIFFIITHVGLFVIYERMVIKMTKYNHLVKEQRNVIEYLINLNKNFTYIGYSINVDRTTISDEIKRNRYVSYKDINLFDKKQIDNIAYKCDLLLKPPYVCNNCINKRYCIKNKLYYNAHIAQKLSDKRNKVSRSGVDIAPETVEQIENTIVPLIKDKKQSVNQVYANHSDVLYFSKTTFYKYVDSGVISLSNIDLPKKVKYKKRKTTKNTDYKRKLAILKGRSYENYLDFILKHPNMNVCEMDTVEGKKGGKVFLTLIICDTKFMLIRLLDKKNVEYVNKEVYKLKKSLGIKLFSKVFRIVLTDNGSEFLDPLKIEFDYDSGHKTCNVFYCTPYSSFQKASIERNHEYIRRVFPKGYSLDNLTQSQVLKLETIINNIPRNKFNNLTPYQMTLKKFPLLIKKLNYKYIKPDNVSLSIDELFK